MTLTFLIAVGALIGAFDCMIGNKLRLGEKFEEGFLCMGATALNMAGIICIAPVIGILLKPLLVPLYRFLGADPAMFGSLFANNMGGYPLAMELAADPQIGLFSGLIVSSMLGATIVYTIPVGLGLIPQQKRSMFAKGIMIGIIPIPIGAFVGGMMMKIPVMLLLKNSIPTILFAAFLVIGFSFFQEKLLRGFMAFAQGIKLVTIFGLGVSAFTYITGMVLIPGMGDLRGAMETIADMSIIQLGSLPLATIFIKVFNKPLTAIGRRLSINSVSVGSLPVACVNVISVFMMVKEMDAKGLVISMAWCTSSICVLTAHLAYTNATNPELLVPMMTAKLVSGFLAILLALWMMRKQTDQAETGY
ncbi:MAG: ethanolamine utilization protein EutH [Hungatella sp.]